MGKPRSREPASGARRARRSLVELTEAATRAANEAPLPPGLIASALDDVPQRGEATAGQHPASVADKPPRARRARLRPLGDAGGRESAQARSVEIGPRLDPVAASAARDLAGGAAEKHDRASRDPGVSESTAEMAVKMAKACQAAALDNVKLGLDAALECAAELAAGRTSPDGGLKGNAPADPGGPGVLDAAADYRVEAFEMMKANMAMTMDYARRLLAAKTSAEFVELSGTHVRTQCELIQMQTRVLRSLARTMSKSDG